MRELTVARKSVGIDIGSHSIKAVVASRKGSSIVIKSFLEVPLPRSTPPPPDHLAAAVQELRQRLKIGSALVVTCISTQQPTVRNLEIPFSEEEKARQILKFQTEPYLAYPIDEVIIDFYNTQTAPADKMKVLLTAIHKGVIEEHLKLLSAGQIDPEVVDVDFMAIANTVLHAEPRLREASAIILDVGASKTVACYVQEGNLLAVRCIALGGDEFTGAISEELGVSFEEAERIKLGESPGDGSLPDGSEGVRRAIGSVLERFGTELDRTVRYFSSQARGRTFNTVILSGGSASLPGLDSFLRETLSADVTVLSPGDTIKTASTEPMPFPRFATAVGLALRGVGESLCLENFRQEEHAYSRPFRRLRKSLAISGALALVIAALLVFSLFSSLDRYRGKELDIHLLLQTKLRTVFPDKTAVDLTHMRNLLKQETDKLVPFRELRRDISILDVLADLSARIPREMQVELTSLDYIKSKLPRILTSKTRARNQPNTPSWVGSMTLKGTISSDPADQVNLKKILTDSVYVGAVEDKGTTPASPGRINFRFILRLKELRS